MEDVSPYTAQIFAELWVRHSEVFDSCCCKHFVSALSHVISKRPKRCILEKALSWHIFQVKCCSWICVLSVCMSVVSFCFVASLPRCVYVCVCMCVRVCMCVSFSTKTSTTTKTPQPWQFHPHCSISFKTVWCNVAKLKGATPLYFAYFGSLLFFLLFISFTCKNTLTC